MAHSRAGARGDTNRTILGSFWRATQGSRCHGLVVKTQAFEACNLGSNPSGAQIQSVRRGPIFLAFLVPDVRIIVWRDGLRSTCASHVGPSQCEIARAAPGRLRKGLGCGGRKAGVPGSVQTRIAEVRNWSPSRCTESHDQGQGSSQLLAAAVVYFSHSLNIPCVFGVCGWAVSVQGLATTTWLQLLGLLDQEFDVPSRR